MLGSDCFAVLSNLEIDLGNLLRSLGFTNCDYFANILERVGAPFATQPFDTTEHLTKTIVVIDVLRSVDSFVRKEVLAKEPIDERTVIDLFLKCFKIFFSDVILRGLLGQVHKIDIAGVNF